MKYIKELPKDKRGEGIERIAELAKRPGEWTEYWGKSGTAYALASRPRKDGITVEAATRGGVTYVRVLLDAERQEREGKRK